MGCIGQRIASQGQDEWQIEQSQQTSMISQEDWANKSRHNFGNFFKEVWTGNNSNIDENKNFNGSAPSWTYFKITF